MNVIIMGSGRVGARLARMFDHDGHNVTILDKDPNAFQKLDLDFGGRTLVGTGIDEDVLKRAGIEHADVFLAVTNLDNPNIMASQIAKLMFNVPRVIARIYDPAREDTYHDLGLESICPTTVISQRIHQAVVSNSDEPLEDFDIKPLSSAPSSAVASSAAVPAAPPAQQPQVRLQVAGNGVSATNGSTTPSVAPAAVASRSNGAPAVAPAVQQEQRNAPATGLRRFLR